MSQGSYTFTGISGASQSRGHLETPRELYYTSIYVRPAPYSVLPAHGEEPGGHDDGRGGAIENMCMDCCGPDSLSSLPLLLFLHYSELST